MLEEALALDRTKTSLIGMTPLGLVELTRKKTRSMLESVMLQTCPSVWSIMRYAPLASTTFR